MAEAEALPDFEAHLQGGIEELKHSSINNNNVLTLINEISQLSEIDMSNIPNYQVKNSSDFPNNNLVLANISKESDFMNQVYDVYKKLNKEGRHPVGRNGVYHVFGLVKFTAYKWLNKIKSRKN